MTVKKSKNLKRSFGQIYRRLLYFGQHSNIHGLRYISESHRNRICKIFWLIALTLCGWGLSEILKGTVKSANQDALNFTPDTNRLKWNTTFPSVTVCEKYRYHKTLSEVKKLFSSFLNDYPQKYSFQKMFAEMCFADFPCNFCNTGCGSDVNCSLDWRAVADMVRKPCAELIHGCSWLKEPLDCCQYFLPIDTTFGTCYSFNTLQSKRSGSVSQFKSDRSTGPGHLSFLIHKDLEVYIHGEEEIPWVKSDADLYFVASDSILFEFKITEMENYDVKNMDLTTRKCRFGDEIIPSPFGQSFQVYGYSTCMVICETELMYQRCQCIHHLRDKIYANKTCNYTGLGCIATFIEERKKMSVEESQTNCEHCVPSCEEIELTRVFQLDYDVDGDARVDIRMTQLPNIQYRRDVVRTNLDLVVSVGGLAGLFFGASLLSLVEAIYIIFIRARGM